MDDGYIYILIRQALTNLIAFASMRMRRRSSEKEFRVGGLSNGDSCTSLVRSRRSFRWASLFPIEKYPKNLRFKLQTIRERKRESLIGALSAFRIKQIASLASFSHGRTSAKENKKGKSEVEAKLKVSLRARHYVWKLRFAAMSSRKSCSQKADEKSNWNLI